ncbi:hypothetical protein JX266_002223 [Neoarthrinium moseri]|nr:hypothetical protein JX266_002223 [Neoarthrinium moseri]
MAASSLRIIAAASFLPAFPLLLAHGVVSHSPVPATGLVPLAFSAGTSLFLVLRQNTKHSGGSNHVDEETAQDEHTDSSPDADLHPFLVFGVDVVLSAALLIVLVFSWLQSTHFNEQLATLAAYATIPLLVNFFIHLYLAVRSFSTGLALHDLTQWLAWQVVPADCPDCGHRLRPSSAPTIPWLESARRLKLPAVPNVKAPRWKAPAWLPKRSQSYAPLLADDEHERYTDEPEEGGPSTRVEEPAEVAVVGKRDKKAKDVSSPIDE